MPLPTVGDLARWLTSWHERIAARARWAPDDNVEEASKPSDVANVRDVAMDDDHAAHLHASAGPTAAGAPAASAEDDFPIALDPVASFSRVARLWPPASSRA